MKLILTESERKALDKMQYAGDQRGYKVYDADSQAMLNASLFCDCGKKSCEHKRLLLIKILKEYKVN